MGSRTGWGLPYPARRGPFAFAIAFVVVAVTAMPLARAGEQDVAEGSVAAAIREAGHACGHVVAMERSTEGAAEGFTVWVVRCNSGRFKVTFKGDTGAGVQPLGQ